MDEAADVTQLARGHYEAWFGAVEKGDAEALAALIHEDFHYVDIFGEVRGKDSYLEMVRSIPVGQIAMSMVEIEASDRGPVLLVRGTYVVEGALASGKDISSQSRFTAAWLEDWSGRRCLVHHATRIP